MCHRQGFVKIPYILCFAGNMSLLQTGLDKLSQKQKDTSLIRIKLIIYCICPDPFYRPTTVTA